MPTPQTPIRVAVVGVGHIGTLHAEVYAKLSKLATLTAVCDVDRRRAEALAGRLGCRAVTDVRDLLGRVDAASVSVPTSLHHAVGKTLLDAGIHTLIEKPIAVTLKEADDLLARARKRKLIVQVGHIERFNAAIQAAQEHLTHPRFIEVHRLSPYPVRGTDVSVVLDVMIHDLDLVLSLVKSQPVRIDALGLTVLSKSEDIANARLIFPSGCVANLTASRISDEKVRRLRLFQEDCYLSIDYQHQAVELARKAGASVERRQLSVHRRPALDEELRAFLEAVRSNRRPLARPGNQSARRAGVSAEEAREALRLALNIERAMRSSRRLRSGRRPRR